jgi:hypothetical protein
MRMTSTPEALEALHVARTDGKRLRKPLLHAVQSVCGIAGGRIHTTLLGLPSSSARESYPDASHEQIAYSISVAVGESETMAAGLASIVTAPFAAVTVIGNPDDEVRGCAAAGVELDGAHDASRRGQGHDAERRLP